MLDHLKTSLNAYHSTWADLSSAEHFDLNDNHKQDLAHIFNFVEKNPDCCDRSCARGHLTGSALVVTPDLHQVLLTLHRKLNVWLQLGGHADGDQRLDRVAMREAEEESGLTDLAFWGRNETLPLIIPFDIDIHTIPAYKSEASHMHFDVRYLIIATGGLAPVISKESHQLRWFSLDDARKLTPELSMHRQFAKVAYLRESGLFEHLNG